MVDVLCVHMKIMKSVEIVLRNGGREDEGE
jgi:hypothetical protein